MNNNIRNRIGENWGFVVEILVVVFVVIIAPINAWNLMTTVSVLNRLSAIEATSFRSSDATEMALEVSKIWQELSKMSRTSELPPAWFIERVARMEEGNVEMRRQLLSVEKTMISLEQSVAAESRVPP